VAGLEISCAGKKNAVDDGMEFVNLNVTNLVGVVIDVETTRKRLAVSYDEKGDAYVDTVRVTIDMRSMRDRTVSGDVMTAPYVQRVWRATRDAVLANAARSWP
jgi:hypothetical protein